MATVDAESISTTKSGAQLFSFKCSLDEAGALLRFVAQQSMKLLHHDRRLFTEIVATTATRKQHTRPAQGSAGCEQR
ncbi:MAG TPA: hypothetical protein GYA08_20180 [Chloroflexi bacterium]|nr:hypothetical protein [Chloroflexota bacterium]